MKNWINHIWGGLITIIIAILINLALLAGAVYVVVSVLKNMGVL